ncbi:hypothetical protein PLESTB_001065000 [Pleodorina starrii]|uniref:Uncharacterized protein n=1 Tax=Pleodorina starrii TaxID=330485 RepID=A0A9W6BRA7_9CHLO|nr:hypothetical protein PLESTB_001065000 [Pleodorina starrii]
MGVNKATKKMARKGQLKNAIHARRKHKRRQPHKGSRAPSVVKAGDEFRKEGAAGKKKKGAFEDMDAEEFLQGGFEDDFEDDDELGDDDDDDILEVGDDEDEDDDADLSDLSGDDEDGEEMPSGGSGPDEDEDDDEEEEEGGGGSDPVVQDNKRLKGEISKHRAQLEALREKDPEFYQYLKDADAELLGFGAGEDDDSEGGDEDDEDDEEDDEEEEGAAKKADNKKKEKEKKKKAEEEEGPASEDAEEQEPGTSGRVDVTSALVARWCNAARGGPEGRDPPALGSFGFLVRAYRLASHYGDPQEDLDSGRLRITSSSVYNSIMMFMLREADGIFRRLLGLPPLSDTAAASGGQQQQQGGGKGAGDLTKNSRWRKVGPLVKSFWGNSVHLVGTVTDPALLAFTLRRLRASVSLLAPFARLRDRFLRSCLGVFGGGEVAPRLQAFLAIRAMAVSLPQPALDNCLK